MQVIASFEICIYRVKHTLYLVPPVQGVFSVVFRSLLIVYMCSMCLCQNHVCDFVSTSVFSCVWLPGTSFNILNRTKKV